MADETQPLLSTERRPRKDGVASGKHFPFETFWLEHRDWLEEQGYKLRARYQPGWRASWLEPGSKPWFKCEDAIVQTHPHLMDATRTADGHFVILKKLDLNESKTEYDIATLVSSEPHLSNPANHCMPILETLPIPGMKNSVLVVMPLLLPCYFPAFWTSGEAFNFVEQLFEGVKFMHGQRILHGDIKADNVVMDGYALLDKPPHPNAIQFNQPRDFEGRLKQYTRTEHPVRYYFIDFGFSRQFSAGEDTRIRPWGGGDLTVPEFNHQDLCDPFKVDVYRVANIIRITLMKGDSSYRARTGLEFLNPLIEDMVQDDPSKRPTMAEAVDRLANLRERLWWWQLRTRIRDSAELSYERVARNFWHWFWTLQRILLRTPAIPTPHEAPWWL